MLVITWKAPEPEEKLVAPRSLRDAVWLPFLGFLSRHRAVEILAFVGTASSLARRRQAAYSRYEPPACQAPEFSSGSCYRIRRIGVNLHLRWPPISSLGEDTA